MLARRLQRRHNIKTTLCQCLVLAGYRPTVMPTWLSSDVQPMPGQCWLTVCYAGPVFTRRWSLVSSASSSHTHWWQRHRKRWASVIDVEPELNQRVHWFNASCFHWTGKILGHRLRRWPNIEPPR